MEVVGSEEVEEYKGSAKTTATGSKGGPAAGKRARELVVAQANSATARSVSLPGSTPLSPSPSAGSTGTVGGICDNGQQRPTLLDLADAAAELMREAEELQLSTRGGRSRRPTHKLASAPLKGQAKSLLATWTANTAKATVHPPRLAGSKPFLLTTSAATAAAAAAATSASPNNTTGSTHVGWPIVSWSDPRPLQQQASLPALPCSSPVVEAQISKVRGLNLTRQDSCTSEASALLSGSHRMLSSAAAILSSTLAVDGTHSKRPAAELSITTTSGQSSGDEEHSEAKRARMQEPSTTPIRPTALRPQFRALPAAAHLYTPSWVLSPGANSQSFHPLLLQLNVPQPRSL